MTIFIVSFISFLQIINVVVPDLNIFLRVAAFVADAAAVDPIGNKTLSANDLNIFPIKDNPVFSSGPKSLPKNLPDCPIFCNWVFDNFILAEELFAKLYEALKLVY